MRAFAKAIAGIAIPLFLIGAVLTAIGWYMGTDTYIEVPVGKEHIRMSWDGIHFSGWNHEAEESAEENMELEAFTDLEVKVSAGNVTVTTGEGYGIRLRRGSRELEYSLKDGVLKVWDNRSAGASTAEVGGSVEIFLPDKAALTDADITSGMGSVTLEGLQAETLSATADLGEVTASGLRVGSAVLTLNCGSLSLADMEADAVEAKLAMGSMAATGLSVVRQLTVISSMGPVSLEGELGEAVHVEAEMGDISVASPRDEQWYGCGLRTDMGDVKVNGRSCGKAYSQTGERGNMELYSGMGNVSASFQ